MQPYEIKSYCPTDLSKRVYLAIYVDGQRYREYNGKKIKVNLQPNRAKSLKNRRKLLGDLEFEFRKKLDDGSYQILPPSIRISHPIKGRIPEAKDKPAHLLREEEETIYYERMAFILEIPTISDTINGNPLSLTIGGIKAHNQDNLYARKGAEEHFKLFIGFQNRVCTNMCVWTDGTKETLRVRSIDELTEAIIDVISSYDAERHLDRLSGFTDYNINESQFAYLIGRARMYQHIPVHQKKNLPQLLFGDNQIGMVVKEYYNDEAFSREDDGSLNLWKLYNLFTSANKSSYIDGFLNKGLNAYGFVSGIREAMDNGGDNWFML